MSRKREPMRKIKEVLRLAQLEQLSERQIATAANMKRSTVRDYLARAREADLTWTQVASMDDEMVVRALFPSSDESRGVKVLPDWGYIHKELHHKHVTLQLLWEEYRIEHPDGYGYSRFCELYGRYAATLDLSMRQTHKAGEAVFLDYSGKRAVVMDAETGEARPAEIFVAVLGASNYTFAEATWTQRKEDWIESNSRAFSFFGGVTVAVVPDNLKSAITTASRYDPESNPTYQQWAEHYGVAILPARPRRPKDKAKVEVAVQIVQRWILASLRHRTFFSLAELNEAIRELLVRLNNRRFRKLEGTRASLFAEIDQPALRPLPATPYEYEDWEKRTVPADYHIDYENHLYSVPHKFVRKTVEIRATAAVIEIFYSNVRIAVHAHAVSGGTERNGRTTVLAHMPPAHRAQIEWTPERLRLWAEETGSDIAALFAAIVEDRMHPQQALRVCLGIKRMEKKVGCHRLNAACRRALAVRSLGTAGVASILEKRQEELPLPWEELPLRLIQHENVRGPAYYRQTEAEEASTPEVRHAATSHD